MRWFAFSCLAMLLACASAQQQRRKPVPVAPARSDLTMREPQARSESVAPELGSLQPVAVPRLDEPAKPTLDASASAPKPIVVASQPPPRPYALRGRELVLPGGLIIHNVPAGVAVRTVDEAETKAQLFELVDRRGRRLALLKESALSQVALPGGAPLLEATAASSARGTRQWGQATVEVTTDRFQSETHLYTLERLSTGTDWIPGGLELTSGR